MYLMICTLKRSVEDYNKKAQNVHFWGQQQYPCLKDSSLWS